MTAQPEQNGEGEELRILADPTDFRATHSDLRLLSRTVIDEWPVAPEHRAAIVNRMLRIVDKEAVSTACEDGGVQYDEDKADRNAIAAAKVLQSMVSHNTRARQPSRQQAAPVVNVGVQVNGNPQPGRTLASAIAERIRIERLSREPAT